MLEPFTQSHFLQTSALFSARCHLFHLITAINHVSSPIQMLALEPGHRLNRYNRGDELVFDREFEMNMGEKRGVAFLEPVFFALQRWISFYICVVDKGF